MNKIILIVLTVFSVAASVVPAMAVDIQFYGTYRVRLFGTNNATDYNNDGAKFYSGSDTTNVAPTPQPAGSPFVPGTKYNDVTDNNSWIDQRFRLAVEGKTSDKLRGFVQLEIGDDTGSDSNESHIWGRNDGTSNMMVSARQGYLSFAAGPARVKAGRQIFGDAPDGGQSFRVTDDGIYYGLIDGGLLFVSKVDAFMVTAKDVLKDMIGYSNITYYFGYLQLHEGSLSSQTTDVSDKDDTLWLIQGISTPSDTLKVGAFFLYERDRTHMPNPGTTGTNKPWWVGGGLDTKLDTISLKAHAIYLGGKFEDWCHPGECGISWTAAGKSKSLNYGGYALDIDVSTNISGKTKFGFAAGRGSGDNNTQDRRATTFIAPASNAGLAAGTGSYGQQLGARPAIFFDTGEVSNGGATLNTSYANGINNRTLGNVTFAELYSSYKASDDLTVSALVAGFWHSEKKRTTSSSNTNRWERKLGTELDITGVYKLYKELTLSAQAAWFFAGDGMMSYTKSNNDKSGLVSGDSVSEYFARVMYEF